MARLNNPFVVYGYKGAEYFCDRFFAKWLVRGGIIANWGSENYVPMQHLLRPDAVTDTSGRNFRSILVPIKWASFASCTSLRKFIRFIESTDTTALGDGFDCAGWRIRLRWVKDTTSLGGRVNFVGWIKHLMLQNEVVDFAEWSTWIRRLMLLNFQL